MLVPKSPALGGGHGYRPSDCVPDWQSHSPFPFSCPGVHLEQHATINPLTRNLAALLAPVQDLTELWETLLPSLPCPVIWGGILRQTRFGNVLP